MRAVPLGKGQDRVLLTKLLRFSGASVGLSIQFSFRSKATMCASWDGTISGAPAYAIVDRTLWRCHDILAS